MSLAQETLSFLSGGERCMADLYRPDASTPTALVIMAHGLGGTRNMRLPAFAERFATAGYACLVFDYRHFGDSGGQPRQLLDIQRQLADWRAAIEFAKTLPYIDKTRLVLWGTSFGGGHVLATAAGRDDIAAVIAQCPFTNGLASTLATEKLVSVRLTALALRDRLGSFVGADPLLVPLAGHPGETAFMTAPDAWSGYMGLIQPGENYRNEAAARFALDIVRYYPGRQTPKISAPVLFCVCDTDTVAPAAQTLRHARKAPRHEIKQYSHGHFDIYVGDAFESVVGDQVTFLKKHVSIT